MKKGTAVKFLGTEKKQLVEKTFIWDVAKISETESLYLIEHPEGLVLSEVTLKDFEGFNTDKLHFGKKYLVAYRNELLDLENFGIKKDKVEEQPKVEFETITTTMPKVYFEQVKDLIQNQKEQCLSNKTMIKMAQGIKDEEFNEMIEFFTELIKSTDNALNQPQNV